MTARVKVGLQRHTAVALVVVVVVLLVGSGADATPIGECDEFAPTITGTTAAEELVGTPGRDVIAGLGGDDVIVGRGGDDVLVGDAGDDVLHGGDGHDIICGGNGDDVLLGADGDDTAFGGSGVDLLSLSFGKDRGDAGRGDDLTAGGPGDDDMVGDKGNDTLGGVEGDDALDGGTGDDRLAGSEGKDTATGGRGADGCKAEKVTQCEAPLEAGTRSAVISDVTEVPDAAAYDISWHTTASAGVRLVELYAGTRVVDHKVVADTTAASGTFRVPVSALPSGDMSVYVVVTDGNGEQTASEATVVSVAHDAEPTPQALITLNEPLPIAELVALLDSAGLAPVEYRAADVEAPPLTPSAGVVTDLETDGFEAYVPPDSHVVYLPQGTPLVDQVADLTAYYARQGIGGTPTITSLLVEGPITAADLGPLSDVGALDGVAVPPAPVEDENADAAATRTAADTAPDAEAAVTLHNDRAPAKNGRFTAGAPQRLTAAAVEAVDGFWPTYGSFNVEPRDHTRTVNACGGLVSLPWPACTFIETEITEEKVELHHELVFTPDVLAAFDDRVDAYEHNVKVFSPGRTGKRPACNPFSAGNFYIRAETSKFLYHNIPESAQLYHDDVTAEDPCSSNEVTFGVVHPERLLDSVPPGRLPAYTVNQESTRNDDADRTFNLNAQTLSRDNVNCDRLPTWAKKFCIGVDVGDTRTAVLARTGGDRLDVELPTCVVWKWRAQIADGPEVLRECGADRDHDGFDDSVDCAPDDPAINPGAIDVPNDGIDQNCDGRDLVVGEGTIQVTLLWNNDNDMDLHVIEPDGRRIWYSSPGPTTTGGRLDRDDNVAVCGADAEPGGVENIYWPEGTTPQHGTYAVEVQEYNRCADPAELTVEVRIDGEVIARRTTTGTDNFTFTY